MPGIPLITRGAVLRLPFAVLAGWGIYKLIEPYLKGSSKTVAKAVSAKNTGIREGVTKFLSDCAGRGSFGTWSSWLISEVVSDFETTGLSGS